MIQPLRQNLGDDEIENSKAFPVDLVRDSNLPLSRERNSPPEEIGRDELLGTDQGNC
jgi:hypothetical protein